MAEARTYLTDELEQKEAKKIASFLFRSVIDSKEEIIAIFGYAGMMGCACLISTRDLLLYFSNASMRPQQAAILYSDLIGAAVKSEGKNPILCLTTQDGKETTIRIKASAEETNKMAAFIQGYQTEGAAFIAQQMQADPDYAWKIDAVHQGKNLKNAAIDKKASIRVSINQEKSKAKEIEIKDKHQIKEMEIHNKYAAIRQRDEEKINRIAASRSISHYTLDYCGGLPGLEAAPVKITVNSREQVLEIAPQGAPEIRIPFSDIHGSQVTTDTEIPPDDVKNEYTYLLHIACTYSGSETEIIFSHRQKQNATVDPIAQMNYAMEHIGEKITEYQAHNAKYDQRAQELAVERERLLA